MKKVFSKANLAAISVAVFLAGSSALVLAGPHCKENDREHGLEKMIRHLDLSNAQNERIEIILESVDRNRSAKKGMPKMRALMALNPEDTDYLQQVEAHADAASKDMKARILEMARVRQEIHAVLTDEQKQALKDLMHKKMKRMEKRYEDD